MALTPAEQQLLRFETQHPEIGALKNEAIRSQLGLSPVRYYQKLSRLADSVDALQFDSVLVHRIRRMRDTQRTAQDLRTAPRP